MTRDPIITAVDFTRLLQARIRLHLNGRLTLTQYATLVRADNSTAAVLAVDLGVTGAMVSKTVRDLQLLGYLTTAPTDDDRRRRLLQVTPRGRKALASSGELELPADLLAAMQDYVDGAAV